MMRRFVLCLCLFCAAFVTGCADFSAELAKPSEGVLPPVLNPATKINRTLRALPPPDRRVAVAVYGYTDQTGQFKPGDNFQSLSRAVTQGSTSVLIKALQDAGEGSWFTVVEREKLDNLLKERRIITDMRERYLGEKGVNAAALPPLLFAGILLEGGIIGYDSDTRTGGAGARYLGVGGDIKYREDTVTMYLRAISTKTGEVLVSVVSHKTIVSVGIQGGAFKFVAVDKILEAEAGITRNEPEQIAVQQAIEKAVHALIIDGAARGLWSFADKYYQSDAISRFDAEQDSPARLAKAPVSAPNGAPTATASVPPAADSTVAARGPPPAQPTRPAPPQLPDAAPAPQVRKLAGVPMQPVTRSGVGIGVAALQPPVSAAAVADASTPSGPPVTKLPASSSETASSGAGSGTSLPGSWIKMEAKPRAAEPAQGGWNAGTAVTNAP